MLLPAQARQHRALSAWPPGSAPWPRHERRPYALQLSGYLRQNIIEDVRADIFDVAQSTISRYITFLTPFIETAADEERPTAEDAAETTRDVIALAGGTLRPCWS